MSIPRFTALWEFFVPQDCQSDFEKAYGPEGAWVQLFRRSVGHLGSELIRDLDRPGRYVTLDHWTSRDAFHNFKREHADEYAAIDQQCERLTEREVFLGAFESCLP